MAVEKDGFSGAMALLEFDLVRENLSGYTRTRLGRRRARELAPDSDAQGIAARHQETSEARRCLEQGLGLEFGPDVDMQEYVQRALLGGLLRGPELRSVQLFIEAGRSNRAALVRRQDLPLLAGIAGNMPVLGDLAREIFSSISPAGEVLDDASPALAGAAAGIQGNLQPADRDDGAELAAVSTPGGGAGTHHHPAQRSTGAAH